MHDTNHGSDWRRHVYPNSNCTQPIAEAVENIYISDPYHSRHVKVI
jgi:hypothetical protein